MNCIFFNKIKIPNLKSYKSVKEFGVYDFKF